MVCISSSEAWKKEEEAISERNVRLILEAAKASLRSLRHTPPLSHSLSLSPSVSPFSLALSLPNGASILLHRSHVRGGEKSWQIKCEWKAQSQPECRYRRSYTPPPLLSPPRKKLTHRLCEDPQDVRTDSGPERGSGWEKECEKERWCERERDREGNRWAHLLMKESEGGMGRHSGSHIHCVLQLSLSLGLSLCRPMNNARVRLCQWNLHSRSDLVCSSDQGPFQQSY